VLFAAVHFAENQDAVLPGAHPILEMAARALREHLKVGPVHLLGWADAREGGAAGLRLSARRAAVVRDYLVASGIDPCRLVAAAHRSAQQERCPDSEAARAEHRRVEIHVD